MPRYSTYFPIPASAKFTVELPEGSTPEQIREALRNSGESQACLCYQCSKHLEIDDSDVLSKEIEDDFAYSEE